MLLGLDGTAGRQIQQYFVKMKRKCKENAHTWKAESGSSQSDKFSFCVQNVQLFFVLVVVNCGQSECGGGMDCSSCFNK